MYVSLTIKMQGSKIIVKAQLIVVIFITITVNVIVSLSLSAVHVHSNTTTVIVKLGLVPTTYIQLG